MAYFPNGSYGGVLDDQCHDCPLGYGWDDPEQKKLFEIEHGALPCPTAFVQLEYNYDQIIDVGCKETADWLESLPEDERPKFIERDGNTHYPSSENQLKAAIQQLRSNDMRNLMNLLVDENGNCKTRELLVQLRDDRRRRQVS